MSDARPATVKFREPFASSFRRTRQEFRRVMPTFTKRPVASAVVWTAFVVAIFEYVGRQQPLGAPLATFGGRVLAAGCIAVGFPALLFAPEFLLPKFFRIDSRGVWLPGRYVFWPNVRHVSLRRTRDFALLRIRFDRGDLRRLRGHRRPVLWVGVPFGRYDRVAAMIDAHRANGSVYV